MTATDELRKLLDERGVEWWNETDPEPQSVTMARTGEQLIAYHENVNGSIGYHVYNMHSLTPEQAIAATLGNPEIVRCRDCKHYRPKISRTPGKRECWEAGEPFDREPGEYCSRGERREQ